MSLDQQLNTALRFSIRQIEADALRKPRPAATPFDCLTLQEKHILLLVAEGETNSAIAAKMFLSPGTVRNYVSSILRELQCANRAQAAGMAVKFQLENYVKG